VNAGGATVRRPDSEVPGDRFRLYEVAGAAHAEWMPGCDGNGSTFPTSAFVRAALRRLFEWAENGIAPPRSSPIELATFDVVSVAAVDPDGNALGGVRSPFVDVPLSRFDVHSTGGARCVLVGRETPLAQSVLARRFADAEAYLQRFTESLDDTIATGFLLEDDRAALLAAQAARAGTVFS
jgi:Alpha/beta hydrolase domain